MPDDTVASYSPAARTYTEQGGLTTVHKLGWVAAAAICSAYLIWLFVLDPIPFQDLPNHVARAVVMADLLFQHGARFGTEFSLHLQPIPYVLHDLLLAGLIQILGPRWGAAAFTSIVFLSLPLALTFYLRAAAVAARAQLLMFLVGLYLSSDTFFVMAFMGFRLALAFILVNLGLAEKLRRRWSWPLFALYVAVAIVGYLTHLVSLVFLTAILMITSVLRWWWQRSSVRTEVLLVAPLLVLLGAHFLILAPHSTTDPPTYEYFWGTWRRKLVDLGFEFRRFGGRPGALLLLLAMCLLWPVRYALRARQWLQPAVIEPLLIAGAFLLLYGVFPEQYADSAYVDVRALPIIALMLIFALLALPGKEGRAFQSPLVLAGAAVLALANLGYLIKHVGKYSSVESSYRQVAAAVPQGAHVMPVHTRGREGEVRPLLHAGSFLVMDRGVLIPYLFSGDRGDPMKYFRYQHHPYMADEQWYSSQKRWDAAVEQTYEVEGRSYTWRFAYSRRDREWSLQDFTPVDWNRVACDYDYLLATAPVNMKLIGVPTKRVTGNDAAVLLSVDKQACHPERVVMRRVHLTSEH